MARRTRDRGLGIDWLRYEDPDLAKLTGDVRVEVAAEAFDMGDGEVKFLAKIGDRTVGELSAFTTSHHKVVQVDNIAVGPRRAGIGTRLYEAAATWACRRAGKPLASDEKRSGYAQAFWEKQVRKRRARCERRVSAIADRAERRAIREDLAYEPESKPAFGRGGCVRYVLKCPAPKTLRGR